MRSWCGSLARRWAAALLILLVAWQATAAPKSKSPPQTAEQKQASEHAAVAAAALKSGDADTAVRELRTARDLAPSADIALDLSRALVLTGNVIEARDTLKTQLASSNATPAPKRASIQAELAKVQARIATLTLDIAEQGAAVKLDDRDLGTTPLAAPVESNPGSHALVISKPGFTAVTRALTLQAGTNALSIELAREKTTGRLIVTSTAEDTLELFLNDRSAGTLPVEADLAPGFYKVAAVGQKMKADAQSVHVEVGVTTSVALAATLLPGEANINAGDAAALIFVDERQVGVGEWHGPVAAGQHSLRIERHGYASYRQPLDVLPAERVVVGQINYEPLPTTRAKDDPTQYEGIFANVALLGLFGTGSTNSIAQDCAANATGGDCTSTHPAGGGIGFRMGYSFGWVALEGLLLGNADAATADATYAYGTGPDLGAYYGVPREEEYAFVRYAFGLGVGARVMSRDPFLRITAGIDGTLLRQSAQYVRATTANTTIPDAKEHTSETESYFCPGMMVDVGVLLGSTPGVKFHTGIALLVTFPPDPVTVNGVTQQLGRYTPNSTEPYGTPPLDLSRGPQVSVGPFLAMQFGH